MYRHFFKRFFDLGLATIAIVLLSPIFLTTSIILGLENGWRNVFFTQRRPSKGGKIFRIIKFRTMSNTTDKNGSLLADYKRITPAGRIIRSCSIDELPQLFNVLRGDMSLVGPRPLLEAYLPLYSPFQARRHTVKPGITGWAQINGRNRISWQQKFEMDVWYAENYSALIDLKIMLLTIKKVLRREGISSASCATMEAFDGTN